MRVLDIFMIVLIAAGTWSPATTQDLKTLSSKVNLQFRGIGSYPNSVFASEVEITFEECGRNGGPMAFVNLIKGSTNYASCEKSVWDGQSFNTEITSAQSDGNWKPVFDKYCQKFSVVIECLEHFTDFAKPCLEQKKRDLVNRALNMQNFMLNFICHHGVDATASFLSADGPKCFYSKVESLKTCDPKNFEDQLSSKITHETSISKKPHLFTLNLDQDDCEAIVSLKTCIVGVFRGCENPNSADALNAMFTAFEKLTTCTNFAASSDGSANSGVISLVSGLLITTAMKMYLRF